MGKHKFNSGRVCKFCAGHAHSLPKGGDGKFLSCPEAPEEGEGLFPYLWRVLFGMPTPISRKRSREYEGEGLFPYLWRVLFGIPTPISRDRSLQDEGGAGGSGGNMEIFGETHASKKQKVEIIIQEDGKFLDLTGVPPLLKLRSGLRKYLFRRDCYEGFIEDIFASLPEKTCKTFAILGTAGIGKSSLFLVLLKILIEDPTKFGLTTRSFYFQTCQSEIWLYRHVHATEFSTHFLTGRDLLDENIPLFVDMQTQDGTPREHVGISLIFTSFRPSRFKELTKNGWHKVMPTWSADEQAEFFNSPQFKEEFSKDVAQRAYSNILFFGGSIRNNIQVAVSNKDPVKKLEDDIMKKGEYICERFFKVGFGGAEEGVSDVLVHRNPEMVDGKYDFGSELCVYSFASPFVLQRLFQLKDSMLVTEARNKYTAGTFSGGDDGNEFELLCLHGFKISDVEFRALPLTDGAQATSVRFPTKKVLALNWREQKDYLKVNMLYIPPYGNLESGDSFCLIKINERWTLVVLQCTIAEHHPVKQNGMKIIHDCYTKNSELQVDDTVIMFMIPVNGKLKTKQPLVTQKKGGEEEVQRVTIAVTAQYKIENALVTVDGLKTTTAIHRST